MSEPKIGYNNNSTRFFQKFKAGIKLQDLKTDEEKIIFKHFDKDNNEILDDKEIDTFKHKVDSNQDGKISRKEARALKNEINREDNTKLKKKDLLNFVQTDAEKTENIKNVTSSNSNNGTTVKITNKDGSIETVNPDKSTTIQTTDENGNVTTQYKNEKGLLIKEKKEIKNADGTVYTIETEYAQDGKTPIKTIKKEYSEDGKTTTKTIETEYAEDGKTPTKTIKKEYSEDGKTPTKTIETEYAQDGQTPTKMTEIDSQNNSTTTINYKDGKLESKEVKQGTTTSTYTYTESGEVQLKTKVVD